MSIKVCVWLTCGPAWCCWSRASDGGGALLVFTGVCAPCQDGGGPRQRRSLLRAPRSSILNNTFSLHLKKPYTLTTAHKHTMLHIRTQLLFINSVTCELLLHWIKDSLNYRYNQQNYMSSTNDMTLQSSLRSCPRSLGWCVYFPFPKCMKRNFSEVILSCLITLKLKVTLYFGLRDGVHRASLYLHTSFMATDWLIKLQKLIRT